MIDSNRVNTLTWRWRRTSRQVSVNRRPCGLSTSPARVPAFGYTLRPIIVSREFVRAVQAAQATPLG